jgi:hypothetical protein
MEWRKSSRSTSGACVEVWRAARWRGSSRSAAQAVGDGPAVGVRDSKDPEPEIWFSRAAWAGFIAGAKAGEFDDLI